jgi:hypothetical protein
MTVRVFMMPFDDVSYFFAKNRNGPGSQSSARMKILLDRLGSTGRQDWHFKGSRAAAAHSTSYPLTPLGLCANHMALAAMLTVRASNVALKMNDTAPWAATRRRSALDVTATSETCDVMPTTNEK